jgi:signal transduction histidine kinase
MVNDPTVLTVVDEFRTSLIFRLESIGVPAEITDTVSKALMDLRSRVQPFENRDQLEPGSLDQLWHRLRAVERRVEGAVAEVSASQRAVEAARRAVWEFICHIGDDLRNPLAAVLNLTDVLSYEDLCDEQRLIVTDIARTGEELFGLVDDLLVLSRLEAGILPLSIGPVAPADAVDDACHIVKPLADDHGVVVTTEAHGGTTARMRADRYRLAHSLAAVMAFAVTSSRPGGDVHVEWSLDRTCVVLTIRDTGHGFVAETLTGLFDPIGWASQPSSGGTRLRLVLARRLVEAMDGSIEVASEPGRGSSFVLRLMRDTMGDTPDTAAG